ncbi:hypothetical protein H6G97_38265 [Nostoc flagelliforme FACHB-838]|uniref:Transposase n=1 Tax=Nostoc flagelliforme FACHB-838 TaxID=2692904 RepID=A0ABR8DZR5_9NOSO|nr:hypothetical protein [Nostoc flagelliforme]MBD2534967.1 hypothetical protein [Nostoc flagelliforme FACHB-838]
MMGIDTKSQNRRERQALLDQNMNHAAIVSKKTIAPSVFLKKGYNIDV